MGSLAFIPSGYHLDFGCPLPHGDRNFWHHRNNNGPTQQARAESILTDPEGHLAYPTGSMPSELLVNGALKVAHITEALNVGKTASCPC